MKHKDAFKTLGAIWTKNMSEEQKKPFYDLSEKDKIRCQQEKEEYEAKGYFVITKNGQSSEQAQKEIFEKASIVKPKKVMAAYQFYMRDRARSISQESTRSATSSKFKRGEFVQVIAKEWRELPTESKSKFKKLRDEDEERKKNQYKELETNGYFVTDDGRKSTDRFKQNYKYIPGTVLPTKPQSAFKIYLESYQEKIRKEQNISVKAAKFVCEEVWNKLNKVQR